MTAIRPAIRSAIQPAIRSAFAGSYGWLPTSLFAAGEQGVWYDPSDLSTMFQDVAGTVPVTADGQLVARINDKSGKGNHATQATEAARPLYKTSGGLHWLQFDGTDDSLATAAINFSATQLLSCFAGVTKNTAAGTANCVAELTNSSTNAGSFSVFAPNSTGGENYLFLAHGGAATGWAATTYTAPITNVLACNYDLAGTSNETKVIPRVNGATPTLSVVGGVPSGGSQTFANSALYIGRRGGTTLPFNGRIYSLIVRGKTTVAADITSTESWVAAKTGVTL